MTQVLKGIFSIIVLVCVIVIVAMFGGPRYTVWQKGMKGESELKQAEWNRQITVKEAEAKFNSSKMLANAEVERAKGVAEANRIIGQSLHNNEGYLRYLWIHNLAEAENNGSQIIYIPTEAGLPMLEAGRGRGKI